jgi:Pectate lyase superfamily protein
MSVSILSYIPSGQHAAIVGRTSTYDSKGDFQTAINAVNAAGGGTLYIPAGTYRLNSTLDMKPNVCLLGDGPDGSTLEWPSTHTGHGIQQLSAVNSATQVNNIVEKIGLVSLAGSSSTGGGYYDRGGGEVRIVNCRFHAFKYGVILDQSEIADIDMCDFYENTDSCIWIVNGHEAALGNTTANGTPAATGYTNRIAIKRCQLNVPGQYSILDDGGVGHSFIDNNFNGGYVHIRAAGAQGLVIQGNYLEAASSVNISFSNYSRSDAGVGPCTYVLIAGNSIFPSASNYCIQSASLGYLTLIANGFGNSANSTIAAVNCANMNMVHSLGNNTENDGGLFQNAPSNVRWSAEALRDGSAIADVGSIAAGASAFVNVTVPNAAVGDRVDFVSASVDLGDDITVSGRVSAANTVRVKLTNTGAAAVDPPSCTYSARVEKRQI